MKMKITKKFEKKLIEYLDKLVDKFMELLDVEISYQKKREPWKFSTPVDVNEPINLGKPIKWPKDINKPLKKGF